MPSSKNKLVISMAALGLALSLVACGGEPAGGGEQSAAGGQTYELRFNHVLSESEPFHAGFTAWAEAVEERTDGGLKIEVYPGGQLGVEEDIIEQMKNGANVGQNTDAARLGMYVEEIAVMNGPYFVDGIEEVEKLKESETIEGYLAELEEQGLKVVSFQWVQGPRNFFTNEPINSPEDLSGLRIRTPGSPIWQESVRALGAEPVAMNFGDMYSGLQQGSVDGAELVWANIPGGKLYEVLGHASETKHITLINFQTVSATWFNSLPEEYQTILIEECDKAGQAASAAMEEGMNTIKADMVAQGMEVNESPDIAAFQEAGEAAYEELGLTEVKQQVWAEIGKA